LSVMVHPLRSLTGKFLLLLLPVALGFSVALFWLLTEHNFRSQRKELRYSLETFVALQASTLGPPLWNYDTNSIRTLFRAYSLNPDVDRVVLYDAEENEVAHTAGTDATPPDPYLTVGQNIYYAEHDQMVQVGRISATFRDGRLKLERERQLHTNLIILTGLFLLIAVAMTLITRLTIGKPLERLRRSLDKAANDTREPVLWNSADELGQVVAAYNTLLARQASAEEEILRYQTHLEDLVAQQTKELRQESDMLSSVLKQLGERQAYMRAIFANAGVGIITLDPDGVAIEANQHFARIIGREVESWDIDDLAAFVHPDDRADFLRGLKALASGDATPYRREFRVVHADGSICWCDLAATGVIGDDGAFLLAVVVLSDMTVRKEAEDKMALAQHMAEDANRAKNDFLANMSHEIRTPMNAVIGLSQLALRTSLTARQSDYVQKIADSANSLLGIINDILDFSKIEAGKMTIETVEFKLDDLLRDITTAVGIRAQEKGLEFVFDIDPEVPGHLLGDPLRLKQILVNLCGNAVKFTATGEIKTAVAMVRDRGSAVDLRFTVSDTGIGMSEDQKSRLFEAFSQADSSITRRYGGTGLGLVICKNLVEMLGGAINVESVESQGTRFWFTIPFSRGSGERVATRADRAFFSRLNILVVDDNATSRAILAKYLMEFGCSVGVAASGDEALAEIAGAGQAYDIVLMDWRMPGMDGIETARRLRAEGNRTPHHIIMISAYDRNEIMERAGETGIDAFLVKPVSPSTLMDSILDLYGHNTRHDRAGTATMIYDGLWRGSRILVVEDNDINRQVAQEILEHAGFEVVIAENGEEAIATLDSTAFDAILMDVQMPVLDGYAATRRLRQTPRFRDLPIIAMTANAMSGDREKALEAGMNDHVAKPLDIDDLFAAIGRWVTPRNTPPADPGPPLPVKPGLFRGDAMVLDYRTALARVVGNAGLLDRLLRQFRSRSAAFVPAFEMAWRLGDRDGARRLVHTFKATAGTVGADRVHRCADQLEGACRSGAGDETIGAALARLDEALAEVATAIDAKRVGDGETSAAAGGTAAVDLEACRGLCARIRAHLEADDTDAIPLTMELAAMTAGTGYSATVKRIEGLVGRYEFASALDAIDGLDALLGERGAAVTERGAS